MRAKKGRRGQAVVEFALMLPIIVLILVGVFDLGRAIWAYNVIANAAREGARVGIIDGTDAEIRAAVRNLSIGLDPISDAAIAISKGVDGRNDTVTVQVNYQFDAATPVLDRFLPGGKIALTSAATMVIE